MEIISKRRCKICKVKHVITLPKNVTEKEFKTDYLRYKRGYCNPFGMFRYLTNEEKWIIMEGNCLKAHEILFPRAVAYKIVISGEYNRDLIKLKEKSQMNMDDFITNIIEMFIDKHK